MSVSGVGVSAGMSDEADADLKSIYQGGDNYLARMKSMSERRSALDQSLKDLQLGIAAKTALDNANRQNEEAQKARDKAQALLSEAEAEAKKTLDQAQHRADRLVGDALRNAEAVRKEAEALRDAASSEAARRSEETNALLEEAKARHADADRARQETRSATEAAAVAERAHTKAKADYQDRLKHVLQAVNELMTKIREQG